MKKGKLTASRAKSPRGNVARGRSSAYCRLDPAGTVFLCTVILALLVATFAIAAPSASADKHKKKSSDDPNERVLDSKFKGHLPITELTEDQAILHALNRLAYGPRPGDVEHIRQIGLEKWIDQQLHPDSIDDSALDARLAKYPTLSKSSRNFLRRIRRPNKPARLKTSTNNRFKKSAARRWLR